MERIGLFGGTFNPIHCGHLHIVEQVRKHFPLDRVHLIPCKQPPHKDSQDLADARDRYEMIRLALTDWPGLEASDVELTRQGPSYTIDTVRHFQSLAADGRQVYLLVGLDAFLEIDTWREYRQLLQRVPLIVLARPLSASDGEGSQAKLEEEFIYRRLSNRYRRDASQKAFVHPGLQSIYTLDLNPLDISSTQVRCRVKAGGPIESLVPFRVAGYIKNKGLYR
jgi:nicotinate-nucleotide adenylyltransferase